MHPETIRNHFIDHTKSHVCLATERSITNSHETLLRLLSHIEMVFKRCNGIEFIWQGIMLRLNGHENDDVVYMFLASTLDHGSIYSVVTFTTKFCIQF